MSDELNKDAYGNPLPPSKCPVCGKTVDAATPFIKGQEKARPRPGDVTVCVGCGEICAYTDEMTLRRAELNDLMKMPESDREMIGKVQDMIKHAGPILEKAVEQILKQPSSKPKTTPEPAKEKPKEPAAKPKDSKLSKEEQIASDEKRYIEQAKDRATLKYELDSLVESYFEKVNPDIIIGLLELVKCQVQAYSTVQFLKREQKKKTDK